MNRYLYFLIVVILSCCNTNKSNLISAIDFNQMIKKDKSAIIIDVRTPEEFNKGHSSQLISKWNILAIRPVNHREIIFFKSAIFLSV